MDATIFTQRITPSTIRHIIDDYGPCLSISVDQMMADGRFPELLSNLSQGLNDALSAQPDLPNLVTDALSPYILPAALMPSDLPPNPLVATVRPHNSNPHSYSDWVCDIDYAISPDLATLLASSLDPSDISQFVRHLGDLLVPPDALGPLCSVTASATTSAIKQLPSIPTMTLRTQLLAATPFPNTHHHPSPSRQSR